MKEQLLINSSNISGGVIEFIGEISSVNLITYNSLISYVGAPLGTVQPDWGWLEFNNGVTTLLVSKNNILSGYDSTSWGGYNSLGVVYGTKSITINSKNYKIRMIRGTDEDPSGAFAGSYPEGSRNSEWAKMFYPIINNNPDIPESIVLPNAPYTEAQLGMNAYCILVQETSNRLPSVTMQYSYKSTGLDAVSKGYGNNANWRPCLELIP